MSLFVQEYLEGAWVDLGTATKCWHNFKTGRLERVSCEDITVQVNVCVNAMHKKRVLDMSRRLGGSLFGSTPRRRVRGVCKADHCAPDTLPLLPLASIKIFLK